METLKLWLKQWIWNSKWVQFSVKEAIRNAETDYATRLFKNAREDVLEEFEGNVEEKAQELVLDRFNALLSNVDLHKIVTIDKQRGILYIGGTRAEEGRLANLKAEAEFIVQSDLWSLLQETPKELAQRDMFVSGDSIETMKKGRSILYTLSTQKNIVEMMKGYEPKPDVHTRKK